MNETETLRDAAQTARAAADTIDRLTAENARLDSLMRSGERRGIEKATEEYSAEVARLKAENARLTKRLGMAVDDMKFVFEQKRAFADSEVLDGIDCICPLCACWLGDGAKSCDGDCNNAQWRGEESE